MNGTYDIRGKGKALAALFVTWVMLASAMMFTKVGPVEAHSGMSHHMDLTHIEIYDGDTLHEICMHSVAGYCMQRTGGAMFTVDVACTFRAMQEGLEALWGNEIPEREDVKVISALPSYSSVVAFEFLTGTGPDQHSIKAKGDFSLVLPDGTEVQDRSYQNLQLLSRDISLENYRFTFMRPSTGESLTIAVKEDVFPAGFFELQKKALFGIPERATIQELDQHAVHHTVVSERFLTRPSWKLFEDAKRPFPMVGGVFTIGMMLLIVAGAVYSRLPKR